MNVLLDNDYITVGVRSPDVSDNTRASEVLVINKQSGVEVFVGTWNGDLVVTSCGAAIMSPTVTSLGLPGMRIWQLSGSK